MIRVWSAVLAIAVLAALAVPGCGSGSRPAPPQARDARTASDAAPPGLSRAPLGAAALAAFAWRSRPGHEMYRKALVAERAGDWPAVVAACKQARDLDPDHLEAAWLEAAALARQGKLDDVLAPLQVAAAGDWGKWGERSFELDLFAGFRASPVGAAWTAAADAYRADYRAALDRALIVGAGGDLYGYDPRDHRWLRVTRTNGAVRAAVPLEGTHLIAFVAVRKATPAGGRAVAVGVVDLATGRTTGEVKLAGDAIKLRWRDAKGGAVLEVADAARAKPKQWDKVDYVRGTRALSDAKGAVVSQTLVIAADQAHLARAPSKDVTADWDEQGIAGAIRIERTKHTVTAPGTTLFDGNTLVWSLDRTRLAMVTAPSDPCDAEPREVVVVEVDTGRVRTIDRAAAPAQVAWLATGELAIARDGKVALYDADGTAVGSIDADAPLWLWTVPEHPVCEGEPPPVVEPIPEPEPEPEPEATESDTVPDNAGSGAQPGTRDAGTTPLPSPDGGR